MARKDALHVSVQDRGALAESKGSYGGRRRSSDAGQLLDLDGRRRETAIRDELGGGVQVAAPGVVAEAAPKAQHLVLRRPGKTLHGRKAAQEALVIGNDGRDLRLLQHHFRKPDPVRIASALPGQIAPAVLLLPCSERACEFRHNRILIARCWPSSSGASGKPCWSCWRWA